METFMHIPGLYVEYNIYERRAEAYASIEALL